MSVNLKMTRFGMCVSVNLTNNDSGYEVNTAGILSKIEDLLGQIEFFENVDIEIKKSSESNSDDETFSLYPDDGITITSYGAVGDMSFSTMNDTIVLDPKL